VRLSPTFSADWPNFAVWASSFRGGERGDRD
jgi:hypothetical protein